MCGENLQLGQDTVGARVGNGGLAQVLSSVDNLAVVNDDSEAASAGRSGPANGLAPLGVEVGHEELLRVGGC